MGRNRSLPIIAFIVSVISGFGVAHAVSAEEEGLNDYRISALDLIQFQIYEEPDTRMVQRVSASGALPLPMIGVVEVEGLTLREAEKKIRTLYIDGEIFIDPQVILVLEQYAVRSVSVLGQVNKPEQIVFPLEADRMSIVQAVTLAGGLTRLAKADSIQVTRMNRDGEERRFIVNLDAYLDDKKKSQGVEVFELRPGDIVFVPERTF